MQPFLVFLATVLAVTLCAACCILAFFLAAWRRRRELENNWPTVDPDAVPSVSVVPEPQGPFMRQPHGSWSQFSESKFGFEEPSMTPDQLRSLRSYYRNKHNTAWTFGAVFSQ